MLKKSALFAAIMFASTTTAHADLVDISAGLNFWNNNTNLRAKYHGYENQFNDEKEIILDGCLMNYYKNHSEG